MLLFISFNGIPPEHIWAWSRVWVSKIFILKFVSACIRLFNSISDKVFNGMFLLIFAFFKMISINL